MNRYIFTSLVLIGSFAFSGSLSAAPTKPKQVGMVVSLKGEASVTRDGGKVIAAKLRTPIYIGDKIETAFRSTIQVDFLDRSKLSLAGSTDARVNDYFFDGTKNTRSDVTVQNGAVKFMAGKIAKLAPQNYKIQTATATIGIRGSSGEFVTSNGKLPGIQKGLQLMKTGGIGITAQAVDAVGPPVVISTSGSGVAVNASGSVQKMQYSGSLVKHYAKTTEKRVADGRAESKKREEKQALSDKKDPKDSEKTAEKENKKESKATAKAANKQEKAERKEQKKQEKAERKEQHKQDKAERSEKKEPASGPVAAQQGAEQKPGAKNEESASLGTMPPPGQDRDEPNHGPGMLPLDAPMDAPVEGDKGPRLEQVPLGEPLAFLDGSPVESILDQNNSQSNESTITASGAVEESQEPASEQWSAVFFGLKNEGGALNAFRESATIITQEMGHAATLLRPGSGVETYMGEAPNLAMVDPLSTTASQLFISSGQNDSFHIVNRVKADDVDKFSLLAVGERSDAAELPQSGLAFYSSDAGLDMGPNAAVGDKAPSIIGSLLVQDGKIADDGFTLYAAADFTHNKIAGITVSGHDHEYDENGAQNGEHHDGFRNEVPRTLFYGDLNNQGNVENLTFFSNSGFTQSHVNINNQSNEASASFGLHVGSLGHMSGSGGFYGDGGEGLVIEGAGTGASFMGAAHQESPEDQLLSQSGSYKGLGGGVRVNGAGMNTLAMVDITNMILNPDFDQNTLSGNFQTDDGRSLAVGSRQFAVDREILFGELHDTNASGTIKDSGNFLVARELPSFFDQSNNAEWAPEDVMMGSWNVLEGTTGASAPTGVYPGMHNFWAAGIATSVGASGSLEDKLAVADPVQRYAGTVAASFVDGDGSLGLASQIAGESASIFGFFGGASDPLAGATGPAVGTYEGHLALAIDFGSKDAVGLAYLPNGSIAIMKNSTNADETGFSGWMTAYHMGGQNESSNSLYQSSSSGQNSFNGFYAGENARSAVIDFSRESGGDPDHFTYGVGVAGVVGSFINEDHDISATGHGLVFEFGTETAQILNNPDIDFSIQADISNLDFSGNMDVDNGTESFNFTNGPLNTFIDKNAFFGKVTPGGSAIQFDSSMTAQTLDTENFYIAGMPGLEHFEHLSWGVWGARNDAGTHMTVGYFAGGITDVNGTATPLPDFSALAASANPIVHYHGPAMGTLVNSGGIQSVFGGTSLEVNFNSAAVTGQLDFGVEQVDLAGTLDAANATIQGSAGFQGASPNGSFRGAFFGNEVGGTFGAQDGAKSITGAFGGKADQALPMQP